MAVINPAPIFTEPEKCECKKCGGGVTLIYCVGKGCPFRYRTWEEEWSFDRGNHLHVVCKVCGYSWPMRTKDDSQGEAK